MTVKYNKYYVTLELDYGVRTVFVQVHANSASTNLQEIMQAALDAYIHITGARRPDNAWIHEMETVATGIDIGNPVMQRSVSIHWLAEELDGIDTQGFREQVTAFGNQLIDDNR